MVSEIQFGKMKPNSGSFGRYLRLCCTGSKLAECRNSSGCVYFFACSVKTWQVATSNVILACVDVLTWQVATTDVTLACVEDHCPLRRVVG